MMSPPTLHDLQFFRNAFPEIRLSDTWEISTSKSDDIIWSVVLAYLNSFPPSDENELARRVKCLTGQPEVSPNIKRSIETCNPFLNRDACFSDRELSKVTDKFKEKVGDFISNRKRPLRSPITKSEYLEVSSKLLSCNIVLIYLEDKTAAVFPEETLQNLRMIYPKHISILSKSNSARSDGNCQEEFSFCIPKEMGIEKQRQALAEILEREKQNGNGERIISHLSGISDNFLISLLKNELFDDIASIYESPCMLLRLADAGFQTDPRAKDSLGKSGFSYALETKKPENVLFLLYNYAANACLQTDATVRSPDSMIVKNLLCLKNDLELLEIDLESGEMGQKLGCLLRDLIQFNEFQIQICKSINGIRIKYNGKKDKRVEALERKEIILTILETYDTYFNYINRELKTFTDVYNNTHFQEFLKHKYYFDGLDLSTAFMFFDNLFLLKERLKLEGDSYLDVESNFFHYVFFRRYLKLYTERDINDFLPDLMLFQERLSLQKKLGSFRKILEKTDLSEDTVLKKVPKEAVYTLINLPEIYGQFFVSKLKRYLTAAITTRIKAEDGPSFKNFQSMLVIERCLQVIGECCEKGEFKSVLSILILALSKDFSKCLNNIRHSLSHVESPKIFYRKKLEKDVDLFVEIQKELMKLSEILRPIYSIHKYQLKHYLLSYSRSSFIKCQEINILEEGENQVKVILPSPEIGENQFLEPMNSKKIQWKSSCHIMDYIIYNVVSAIKEVLKDVKLDFSKQVLELESHFWCLEQILTHITIDEKLGPQKKLKRLLKKRNSLFKETMEKIRPSQMTTNETNLVTDEPPVEEMDSKLSETSRNETASSIEPSSEHDALLKSRNDLYSETSNSHAGRLADVCRDFSDKEEGICPAETQSTWRKSFVKSVTTFLYNYERIAHVILNKFSCDLNEDFSFKNIEHYYLKLEGKKILKDNEKLFILSSVAEKFQNTKGVKQEIEALLTKNVEFTEELSNRLSLLKIKNQDIKEIKRDMERKTTEDTLHILKNAPDYFLQLTEVMESETLFKKNYALLCEKLELPDEAKNMLSQLLPRQKYNWEGLEFLVNRIKILKRILIDEQDSIRQLWERETTSKKIMHVTEKIVHLYMKDFTYRASVETLIFHCMTISRNKTLKELWRKAKKLCRGINLRNVLAHGNPLLESLGSWLDPNDLPSEFVGMMLQLILDEPVIHCMQQIVEQSKTEREDFQAIMEDERFTDLRQQIIKCDRWKSYKLLIPEKKDKKKRDDGQSCLPRS